MYKSYSVTPISCLFVCGLFLGSSEAQTVPLLMNGDFDQLDGWSSASSDPNVADWFISTVGDFTPASGFGTSSLGNAAGAYAVSDSVPAIGFSFVPNTVGLFQPFTVPPEVESVVLSLDMFVNDWSGQSEFNPNQTARVDIMPTDANPFDVTNVVFNAYLGTDGGPPPNAYTYRQFELLPFVEAGQDYLFRVYVNATENWLHVGVDNIQIEAIVPEPHAQPAVLLLVWTGALVLVVRTRRGKSITASAASSQAPVGGQL